MLLMPPVSECICGSVRSSQVGLVSDRGRRCDGRDREAACATTRCASGARPAPRWRNTRQTARFFVHKEGGLEGCPLDRVVGREPYSRSELTFGRGRWCSGRDRNDGSRRLVMRARYSPCYR